MHFKGPFPNFLAPQGLGAPALSLTSTTKPGWDSQIVLITGHHSQQMNRVDDEALKDTEQGQRRRTQKKASQEHTLCSRLKQEEARL